MFDKRINEMREEIIDGTRKAVMIKSVEEKPQENMPFGKGVHEALNYTVNLAESMGFRTVNMDNMIGYAEYGSGDEMIAVLGHLDVVPEGDGWTYPPYAAEIHDGKIYGRGILDDKGCTIGALYALKAIKESGVNIKRRIRIIFGTNEESGSRGIKYYIEKGGEIPVSGFTPDAEYPIINGEKGIVNFTCSIKLEDDKKKLRLKSIKGGTAPNAVPSYAEVVIDNISDIKSIKAIASQYKNIEYDEKDNKIKAFGKSVHGSIPEQGINAIAVLFDFLENLDFGEELNEYIRFMNNKIGRETDGRRLGIDLEDDISGKLTLNLGTIEGDNSGIKFVINIRYPVTKCFDDFKNIFIEEMSRVKIIIDDIRHKNSLYIDPDSDLIKKLQKVYKEKTGDEPELLSIGGGTYAKSIPNIVAFGPIFRGEPDLDHQPDEYMSIDNLMKNIQIIASAMYELSK